MLPSWVAIDPYLQQWLQEDIGRGDWTTQGLGELGEVHGSAQWVAKAAGTICGLPLGKRVFQLLDTQIEFVSLATDGTVVEPGQMLATMTGPLNALLTGERVALNLAMRLSGIATMTRRYINEISGLSAQLVDTRKTTPGLRVLEKYATYIGGAQNHRMGLDDGIMIKDNHIAAAGGIGSAIKQIKKRIPYPLSIEVETENLTQVQEAIDYRADIIMLDNMSSDLMKKAVKMIRKAGPHIKIEASGNVTLDTIASVANTGVDYISSSAPITRAPWLDLSMRIDHPQD